MTRYLSEFYKVNNCVICADNNRRMKMANQHTFKKGISGNPAGRPAGAKNKITLALAETAQGYTAEALETIVSIMRSKNVKPAVRLAAAVHILDRGYGKPDLNIIRESQAQIVHINAGYQTIEGEAE